MREFIVDAYFGTVVKCVVSVITVLFVFIMVWLHRYLDRKELERQACQCETRFVQVGVSETGLAIFKEIRK